MDNNSVIVDGCLSQKLLAFFSLIFIAQLTGFQLHETEFQIARSILTFVQYTLLQGLL